MIDADADEMEERSRLQNVQADNYDSGSGIQLLDNEIGSSDDEDTDN